MSAKFRDYYEVLQVPRTATDEEIRAAYRRLARQVHPDLHPSKDKDLHTGKMQEINEAYAVLGAKEHRAKYDELGEHWKEGTPPPPPTSYAEGGGYAAYPEQDAGAFSEFFRNMFHQSQGTGQTGERFPSELDIEAELDLSLSEAVQGVEKSFSLMTAGLCQKCRGTGRIQNAFCPVCGGLGEIRRPREVKTRIPPGLTEGSRIRLRGQGNEGARGRGDLYLQIHLRPDARYQIEGTSLETPLRVTPWEAALGSEAVVQTLEGPVRIKIAKGTHTGKRLRLAGKGLGKPAARGDLFIRIEIDIPDKLSPKAEALFKQMEEDSHV
jgi:DnaJ-class molecular chaperone